MLSPRQHLEDNAAEQSEVLAKLRGEIAESGEYHYLLAARAHLHPARLSAILRGRLTLTPEVEARIRSAIAQPTRQRP